jgi:hypothetical protein
MREQHSVVGLVKLYPLIYLPRTGATYPGKVQLSVIVWFGQPDCIEGTAIVVDAESMYID